MQKGAASVMEETKSIVAISISGVVRFPGGFRCLGGIVSHCHLGGTAQGKDICGRQADDIP